jgi:prepilin-type N-terminal cleavage/methylation domain-containing protein
MKRAQAFTLIELLIVVAIIAILAAIAVPNFLEAQVRSKVSRAKADLRSLAIAIEAYSVDYNKPPREYNTNPPWNDPQLNGQSASGIVFPGNTTMAGLSTPIAYITTAWLFDPFVQRGENLAEDEKTFTYQNLLQRDSTIDPKAPNFSAAFVKPAQDFYGAWRMCSIGPDRLFSNIIPGSASFSLSAQLEYDATNGTVSSGNLWRSQKRQFEQPPIGALLGAH